MKQRMPILIIGAGLSGLSLALELSSKNKKYIILEANHIPGGLCVSFKIEDNSWHDFGPHIFHNKDGFDWFKDMVPDCEEFPRNDLVCFENELVEYPIQTSCKHLIEPQPHVEINNYGSYCRHHYGQRLSTGFFFPYNEKFYGTHITNISVNVANRTPSIDTQKGTFLYPKSGKFSTLIDSMVNRLNKNQIKLGYSVDFIDTSKRIVGCGNEIFLYDKLVWCAPLDTLLNMLGIENNLTYVRILLTTYKEVNADNNYVGQYIPTGPIYRKSCESFIKGDNSNNYFQTECNILQMKNYKPPAKSTSFIINRAYPLATNLWTKEQVSIKEMLESMGILLNGRAGNAVHMNTFPIITESKELYNKL